MDTLTYLNNLAGLVRDAEVATTIGQRIDRDTGDALPFVERPYGAGAERKLATKLLNAFETTEVECAAQRPGSTRPSKAYQVATERFVAIAEVASDVLGYGMTPFAARMVIVDAYRAFETAFGPMPDATDSRRAAYRETRIDFTVDMLREVR